MGCVPVAYDVRSGSREIIEHGLSGLLVAPSADAIATALMELTPTKFQMMSAEASRRARSLFSAERVAHDYVQLVEDLTRCRSLLHRSRLSESSNILLVESRSRSPLFGVVNVYHAMPEVIRRRIRHALGVWPTGAQWFRERF
jgi:hypothetical protein